MRVVIKVGTSLIAPGGQIDANILRAMVDQFDLSKNEYLIVTSGAIAAGMSGLALPRRPSDVPRMQACAAVGQSKLMHTYERLFFGKKVVAQLLLSSDDFTSPVRYRNSAERTGGVAGAGRGADRERKRQRLSARAGRRVRRQRRTERSAGHGGQGRLAAAADRRRRLLSAQRTQQAAPGARWCES